jgi:photosystem II stability/assembly factor-like uncharacterized protein
MASGQNSIGYEDPNLVHLGWFRAFVQEDGPTPAAEFLYHGYLELGGLSEDQGDLTPIYVPSPDVRDTWVIAGYVRSVQSLPEVDFTARMSKTLQDIWWKFRKTRCRFNIQVLIGDCESPDDFYSWVAKILLNENSLTEFELPTMNPLSGDANAVGDISGAMMMLNFDRILPIVFEEQADSVIIAEVLDGIYVGSVQCGNCGPADDGCNSIYTLTRANPGSPGLSSAIVFSKDNLANYISRDIVTLGGKSGSKVTRMGRSLVVISEADGAHHTIPFTSLHANTQSAWSRVSGYAVGGAPRVIYPISSNRAIIGGAGGYLYRLGNPGASPVTLSDGSIISQDFNDIDGKGNVVVGVTNAGGVVISINKGESFALRAITLDSGTVLSGNVSAVGVLSPQIWFLSIEGALYYTVDQGYTYTQHPGWPAEVDVINSIRFADSHVGVITAQVDDVATVYRTDTMGNAWSNSAPDLSGLPTAERYNFATLCGYNEIAVGGRVSSVGDGILAVAS